MPINSDKPHLWKADVSASVDLYNDWFLAAAPAAFRESRAISTGKVRLAFKQTEDLTSITLATLERNPAVLSTLRMSTAPPIARDRLIGLAGVNRTVVRRMEEGTIPKRISGEVRTRDIGKICEVIARLIDKDLFPWLDGKRKPTKEERLRAALIVADRDCGASADPIIRNAQEERQLAMISEFLTRRGYQKAAVRGKPTDFAPGTFATHVIVPVSNGTVNIPIDVVIQPQKPNKANFPILVEAKSAGDFTNTNKRRKEEAQKIHQLREAYGQNGNLLLFLCGYFDTGYLGYEAAEGLDWIWEHRIDDMLQLGI
jgi:hypothetical protein